MIQLTRDEILVLIDYWHGKVKRDAGRRPNVAADWNERIGELRQELRTAPQAARPSKRLLQSLQVNEGATNQEN